MARILQCNSVQRESGQSATKPMRLARPRVWGEPCTRCNGPVAFSHCIRQGEGGSTDQYWCAWCGHGRIVVTCKVATVEATGGGT
jgi:hypothetical protein